MIQEIARTSTEHFKTSITKIVTIVGREQGIRRGVLAEIEKLQEVNRTKIWPSIKMNTNKLRRVKAPCRIRLSTRAWTRLPKSSPSRSSRMKA